MCAQVSIWSCRAGKSALCVRIIPSLDLTNLIFLLHGLVLPTFSKLCVNPTYSAEDSSQDTAFTVERHVQVTHQAHAEARPPAGPGPTFVSSLDSTLGFMPGIQACFSGMHALGLQRARVAAGGGATNSGSDMGVPMAVPGLCSLPGWSFSKLYDLPDNGHPTGSLKACAEACKANPLCTGATSPFNPKLRQDCWLKSWSPQEMPNP
jgi:hypothetical protein